MRAALSEAINNAALRDSPGNPHRTDEVAIARVMREELLRCLLDVYVAESGQNRLGYLIYLFRKVDMPRMPESTQSGHGANQHIAAILEEWRTDRSQLRRYLEDEDVGLGLPKRWSTTSLTW